MGAELRIEGDDVVRLATELAELRGVSVADAVAEALRVRLEREREVKEKVQAMLAIGQEIRKHLSGPITPADIDAMLYGPDGLPA